MFTPGADSNPLGAEAKIALIMFGALWSMHWLLRHHDLRRWLRQRGAVSLGLIWAVLIVAIVLSPGVSRAFIYFQF